jgi:CRP-like cAMP-binding protein
VFAVSPTLERIPDSNVLTLAKGQKILCPCDSRALFRIHDGVVGVSVTAADGREALISLLGPGGYFGDRHTSATRAHNATATALTQSTVLRIDRGAFVDQLAADRTAMEAYLAYLAERNSEYEDDLCGHLFDTSERRLLRLLVKLCRLGVMTGGAVELPVRLTHDMLAQMVGTTRSRVTFFMNKFRRQGWIEYGRSLVINVSKIPDLSN